MRLLYQRAYERIFQIVIVQGKDPIVFQQDRWSMIEDLLIMGDLFENDDEVEDDGEDKEFLTEIKKYWWRCEVQERPYEEIWQFVAQRPLMMIDR